MFDSTARTLASGVLGSGPATNAFLESFTVHVRGLLQVFFPTGAQPDDVLAEDYFDEPRQWTEVRGRIPEALATVRQRVGKEIAHLTYARLDITPEAKGWNIEAIWTAMHSVVRRFVEAVPSERLGPSWRSRALKREP